MARGGGGGEGDTDGGRACSEHGRLVEANVPRLLAVWQAWGLAGGVDGRCARKALERSRGDLQAAINDLLDRTPSTTCPGAAPRAEVGGAGRAEREGASVSQGAGDVIVIDDSDDGGG